MKRGETVTIAELAHAWMQKQDASLAAEGWGNDSEHAAAREQYERERREVVYADMEKLGVPGKDIALMRSGSLQRTKAVEAVTSGDWALIVLLGGPGSGKTTAASVWLRDGAAENTMMMVSAARLARWNRYDEAAMRQLLRVGRLVIDDLGVEYVDEKGNFLALLDEVLNERYANRRRTVITTNLTGEQFKQRYGARIADRIEGVGKFFNVHRASLRKKAP